MPRLVGLLQYLVNQAHLGQDASLINCSRTIKHIITQPYKENAKGQPSLEDAVRTAHCEDHKEEAAPLNQNLVTYMRHLHRFMSHRRVEIPNSNMEASVAIPFYSG